MSYGYVYVAQVAMGADMNQCIKAITEAESYPWPLPHHRLLLPASTTASRAAWASAQVEEKKAVEAGYWQTSPLSIPD